MSDDKHIPDHRVRLEAATWLGRLRADDRSERDVAAFREWLAADPEHRRAFDAINTMWETVSTRPHDLRGHKIQQTSRLERRAVLAGFAGLAVVGVGGIALLNRPAAAAEYRTSIGEQRHVSLADGSKVLLDTDTYLTVTYTPKQRCIDLLHGRAAFHVINDSARPFAVTAGKPRLDAEGGEFSVQSSGSSASFLQLQGHSLIRLSSQTFPLASGDRLTLRSEKVTIDRPDLRTLLAWQSGHAVFENEKLSDAIAEMNRYSTTKLSLNDPGVGDLKISGAYTVGDNLAFAESVSEILPVEVQRKNDRIYLLAKN